MLSTYFSSNSVQRLQRRSQKCLSQSKVSHLYGQISLKHTNLVEGILAISIKYRQILFGGWPVAEEKSTCLSLSEAWVVIFIDISANQSPGQASLLKMWTAKMQTCWRTLSTCFYVKFCQILLSSCRGVFEMSQLIRGQGGHLQIICSKIGPKKNTNFV